MSWNKIFVKLGSDMKKPDAVTEITRENYKKIVWTLPVSDFYFGAEQLDFFGSLEKDDKQKRLDAAIDRLRKKYGNNVIQSAIVSKTRSYGIWI